MNKSIRGYLFTPLLFFIVKCSFSQITYQKGYFIDNDNNRRECLIRNLDWKNNPKEFSFKYNEDGVPEKGSISSVKEFGIYDFSIFIRSDVKIDRSGNDINTMTNDRNPVWSEEKLFLKVIVRGKASLYSYEDGNLKRYFYSVSDTTINQLIYKKYYSNSTIAYNNDFRQQLWTNVRCGDTSMSSVEKITYTLKELKNYFIAYNTCLGDTPMEINRLSKRRFFNLKIAPGFELTSLSVSNNLSSTTDQVLNNDLNFRLGIESEFTLPYNQGKWSLIFEPTYEYFSAEEESNSGPISITYRSIEFPLGLRYYFILKNQSRFFINALFISNFAVNLGSSIEVYNESLDISPVNSFAFGGGFDKNRLSLELRYLTNRNLTSEYLYRTTDYRRIAIVLGYRIIKS